jgi:hypothetical protein
MNRVSQAVTFLSWLFEPYSDGFIEIRTMNQGKVQMRFWELPRTEEDWNGIGEACIQWSDAGDDVYVGVLPRWRKGGRDNDVHTAATIWCDIDDLDGLDQTATLAKVTVAVRSGRGLHCYRRLKTTGIGTKPTEQREFVQLLERWMLTLSKAADIKCKNPSRILRIPGTLNWKNRDLPRLVELAKYPPEASRIVEETQTTHPWGDKWSRLLIAAKAGDLPKRERGNWDLGQYKHGRYLLYCFNHTIVGIEQMRSMGMVEHATECRNLVTAALDTQTFTD